MYPPPHMPYMYPPPHMPYSDVFLLQFRVTDRALIGIKHGHTGRTVTLAHMFHVIIGMYIHVCL